jgi:hypothetical protein
MRFLFLTTSILWASIAWGQNGRDCATAAGVSDKAICSNAKLKTLDQQYESQLTQTLEAEILFDYADLDRFRKRWDRDVARCAKPDDEACLRAAYERRFTFLKYLRMSAALEPRLPAPAALLPSLQTRVAINQNLFELLTMDPVLAPVTASLIGADWSGWAEVGAQPEARLVAVPGGGWLIGKGSIKKEDSREELYIAVDLHHAQLSVLYYHDYTGELYEPYRALQWATTAPSWPAEATKILKPLGGKAWLPENARTVGLPSTRLQPLPRGNPNETRDGFERASLLWEDLWELSLISQTEYKQLRAALDKDAEECGKEQSPQACLKRWLEERTVFIRCERIAQGLDRLPANARLDLAKLSATALQGLSTQDLLAVQPVVAPLAASVIGRDWLSWTESAMPASPGDEVEVEPGGRWVIARGFLIHNTLNRDIWVAIDTVDCQLWIVRREQYAEQPKPEIRWASTAAGWPATVAKLFAEQGLDWDTALVRQVGLPATRIHK